MQRGRAPAAEKKLGSGVDTRRACDKLAASSAFGVPKMEFRSGPGDTISCSWDQGRADFSLDRTHKMRVLMLVLNRKEGEQIVVDGVVMTVIKISGSSVRLGFIAPPDRPIRRAEAAKHDSRLHGRRRRG